MIDVILDTLLDTAKLFPFLYLAYLLMEFLEHRSGDAAENWLRKSGKVGPLLGGALGVLPQCGFSAAATGLYAGRIITTGTLIAVYLSTSDEMLPILIGSGAPAGQILKLIGSKLLIGILAGLAVDGIGALLRKKGAGEEQEPMIEELCEREHCHCGDHFALSALKHTLRITLFILLLSFALNTAIFLVGEERITGIFSDRLILANLLSALVGLIPNCAPSVILTGLYLDGILSPGAVLSGLLVNAGIGLLILFRVNRPVRDSVRIVAILLAVSLISGILIDLSPVGAWINA